MTVIADIDTRIRRHMAGIRQAFRGVITLVKAASNVQLVQFDGVSDEQGQDAELFQHYGFTSNPPGGTMAIVLPIGGKTSHGVIIATEHGSYRLKGLKPGEVALYTDEGDSIVLKRGHLIDVTTETLRFNTKVMEVNASEKVDFNAPDVNHSATVTVAGQTNSNGGLSAKGGSGILLQGNVNHKSGSFTQTGGGGFSTDADMVAGGISLRHHKTTGVQSGNGQSGDPV